MHLISNNYYLLIKDYYEKKYLNDNFSNKLFVNSLIYDFYLPYYMIIVCDKVQDHDTGIQMYRIIFTKKYIEKNKFFIGNMLYNLQFFIERVKNDDNFIQLFKDYTDE